MIDVDSGLTALNEFHTKWLNGHTDETTKEKEKKKKNENS